MGDSVTTGSGSATETEGATEETTAITPRNSDEVFARGTGASHRFQVRRLQAFVIEVQDVHFNHDSAVVLADYRDTENPDDDASPDAQDDAQDTRITAIAILAACYRQIDEHPNQKILLAGHTDRSGPDNYNLDLSLKRSTNVLHVLEGEKSPWAQSCLAKHKIEDYQQILKWLFEDWDWPCDPGDIDNAMGPATRAGIRGFQQRYIDDPEFTGPMSVDGIVGPQTWEGFFDTYMTELREVMDVDEGTLDVKQDALGFVDDGKKAVGCGENFPKTSENRSRIDRRVEILFFDPEELPVLDCHPGGIQCRKDDCEIHTKSFFTLTPLPVTPVLRRRFRLRVHLLLVWKDPAGVDHTFPEGMEVRVEFGDASPERTVKVGPNGVLDFIVDKRKQSFTLKFQHAVTQFIASQPVGATEANPERLVDESTAKTLVGEGWRVFRLPRSWSLKTTEWEVDTARATTFSTTRHTFEQLDTIDDIGTHADPVRAELKPHWQFFKLLYFDRFKKHKKSILPIVVEGFRDRANTASGPDTQSNWTTNPEACQCVPWLIRRLNDGTEEAKPDRESLLQFRTQADTFIDSSGATKKYVTKSSGGASPGDVGLNSGEATTVDFTQPNAQRLAFYDLPPLWKSRKYFAKHQDASPTTQVFEDIANLATEDAKPHLFSLDDVVLMQVPASLTNATPTLTPIAVPAGQPVAIFSNLFASDPSDPKVDNVGLYDPDTNLPWFSKGSLLLTTDRNYIATYPNWVRAVVALGSFFDVFDRRTPETPDGVVGARAAVRWVDHLGPGNFVAPAQLNAAGTGFTNSGNLATKPTPRRHSATKYYVVHPFFEQRYRRGTSGRATNEQATGRFDLVFLRCCDVAGTGNDTEVAMTIHYFRFFFNFNPPISSQLFTTGLTPATLNAAQQQTFIQNCMSSIKTRWNGPEAGRNPGRPQLSPKSGNPKLRVDSIWFTQNYTTKNIAHFEMGIFLKTRASMGSFRGFGKVDQTDGQPSGAGNFTFGHENGHGDGLSDEYAERTNSASYSRRGFFHNTPGSPYQRNQNNMMCSNERVVTSRYYWHIAEWLRFVLPGNINFQITHAGAVYDLPPVTQFGGANQPSNSARPFEYNHVNWPVGQSDNVTLPAASAPTPNRSRFDLFLYALGQEAYSTNVLNPGSAPFDGILVVLVKMRFTAVHVATLSSITTLMRQIDTATNNAFNQNNRFFCTGTSGGRTFNRCLIYFFPRYLVDQFPTDNPAATNYARRNGLSVTPADIATLTGRYQTHVNQILSNHAHHVRIRTVLDPSSKPVRRYDKIKVPPMSL